MDPLFNQDFVIKRTVNLDTAMSSDIANIFAEVVRQHNYKVTKHTDLLVKFEGFGPKPVSRHEAAYYMEEGKLEIVAQVGSLSLNFTYTMNFAAEAYMLSIPVLVGVLVNHWVLIACAFLILNGLHTFKVIKTSAEKMLTQTCENAMIHNISTNSSTVSALPTKGE
jgi:phosphate/sulfate permease